MKLLGFKKTLFLLTSHLSVDDQIFHGHRFLSVSFARVVDDQGHSNLNEDPQSNKFQLQRNSNLSLGWVVLCQKGQSNKFQLNYKATEIFLWGELFCVKKGIKHQPRNIPQGFRFFQCSHKWKMRRRRTTLTIRLWIATRNFSHVWAMCTAKPNSTHLSPIFYGFEKKPKSQHDHNHRTIPSWHHAQVAHWMSCLQKTHPGTGRLAACSDGKGDETCLVLLSYVKVWISPLKPKFKITQIWLPSLDITLVCGPYIHIFGGYRCDISDDHCLFCWLYLLDMVLFQVSVSHLFNMQIKTGLACHLWALVSPSHQASSLCGGMKIRWRLGFKHALIPPSTIFIF